MAPGDQLTDLLMRWEEAFAQGIDLTPEQLCTESSDCHERLRGEIAACKRFFAEFGRLAGDRPPDGESLPSIPGYVVIGKLGLGGMGIVYRAQQISPCRTVAIKMMRFGLDEGDRRRRFRIEAEAIARLSHPGIVQIYEVGELDGLPYLTLEFCPGGNLEKRLDNKPLSAREAAQLLARMARAMQAMHQVGIVHRDLKPANVLLGADGSPRIADFGLARLLEDQRHTESGAVMGTPQYMAPEQARADSGAIGPAVDVWALGAILYECLTGKPPFRGATPMDTLMQVMCDDPVPPEKVNKAVNSDLRTVCLKCLQKNPLDRYGSSGELADDIERWLSGYPIQARSATPVEHLIKWARRKPAAAALVLVSLLLLLLTLGGGYRLYQERQSALGERATAVRERQKAQDALAELEATMAQGLLRPLWANDAYGRLPGATSLLEIAELPPSRETIRQIVLFRAVGDAKTSAGIANLPQLVRATVGLSSRRRQVALALLRQQLLESGSPHKARAAVARCILDLEVDEQPLVAESVQVLLEDLQQTPGSSWHDAEEKYLAFLEQAALLPDQHVEHLSQKIIAHLRTSQDRYTRGPAADALNRLAQRDVPVTRRLCADAVTLLAQAVADSRDVEDQAEMLASLRKLAVWIPPEQAKKVCAGLIRLLRDTKHSRTLAGLGQTIAVLSRRLPRPDAGRFSREAAGRLFARLKEGEPGQETTPLAPGSLTTALAALSDHLPEEESCRLARDAMLLICEKGLHDTTAQTLAHFASKLQDRDGTIWQRAIRLWTDRVKNGFREVSDEEFALHVKQPQVDQVAELTARELEAERDAEKGHTLGILVAKLAGRMREKQAAQVTSRAVNRLLALREATPRPRHHWALDAALLELARHMDEEQASRQGRRFLQAIAQSCDRDPDSSYGAVGHKLGQAMAVLSGRLRQGQALPLCQTAVEAIDASLDNFALSGLGEALAALADREVPRETAEFRVRAISRILEFMKQLTASGMEQSRLGRAVALLSRDLDPLLARQVCTEALNLLIRSEDQQVFPSAILLARHLEREKAETVYRRAAWTVLEVPSWETGWPKEDLPLENLCNRFDLPFLVDMLKHPACAGEQQQLVLEALGSRLKRQFSSRWQVVWWLEQNCPDIDLESPLPVRSANPLQPPPQAGD